MILVVGGGEWHPHECADESLAKLLEIFFRVFEGFARSGCGARLQAGLHAPSECFSWKEKEQSIVLLILA